MCAGVVQTRAIDRDELREAFLQASADPLFVRDIAEVEEDFRWADAETAAMVI